MIHAGGHRKHLKVSLVSFDVGLNDLTGRQVNERAARQTQLVKEQNFPKKSHPDDPQNLWEDILD